MEVPNHCTTQAMHAICKDALKNLRELNGHREAYVGATVGAVDYGPHTPVDMRITFYLGETEAELKSEEVRSIRNTAKEFFNSLREKLKEVAITHKFEDSSYRQGDLSHISFVIEIPKQGNLEDKIKKLFESYPDAAKELTNQISTQLKEIATRAAGISSLLPRAQAAKLKSLSQAPLKGSGVDKD